MSATWGIAGPIRGEGEEQARVVLSAAPREIQFTPLAGPFATLSLATRSAWAPPAIEIAVIREMVDLQLEHAGLYLLSIQLNGEEKGWFPFQALSTG